MSNAIRSSQFAAIALLLLLAVIVLTGCSSPAGTAAHGARPGMSAPTPLAAGEALVIPVSEVTETARFYPVEVDGTIMEVLAVKAPDGSIRTAFNTCEVCFDSGAGYYTQQGDELVCANCGNRFATDHVEIEAGGCNPWPIFASDKTVTDDTITIGYEFLQKSAGIFANWVA